MFASASGFGRLEMAAGGTLVLDEVTVLSVPAQAKLLRVIEERRFDAWVALAPSAWTLVLSRLPLAIWSKRCSAEPSVRSLLPVECHTNGRSAFA